MSTAIKPPFLDTGTVAGLLRWHPNTIRDHLVPVSEWTEGSSEIPSLKLGGRYMIPRWWVEKMMQAGTRQPGETQKTPGTPDTP